VRAHGEVIENYLDNTTYPSHLMLGPYSSRYIHVAAADNYQEQDTIIITASEPDSAHWDSTFHRRKTP
jgi:hypothetical protein